MIIRNAQEKDLRQLSILFNDYRVFYRKEADLEGAFSFLQERIRNNDSEIFVCESDEQVLMGFVQLYPLFSSTQMKKLWLLNDLFVNPSFRGQGVSVALIEKAKSLVKESKASGMFLETEKSNVIGNKLYPRTNFKLNESSSYYEWNNPELIKDY